MVFRPMSSEVYDDVILFKVLDGPNAGGFNVPVRALLPTLQVQYSAMPSETSLSIHFFLILLFDLGPPEVFLNSLIYLRTLVRDVKSRPPTLDRPCFPVMRPRSSLLSWHCLQVGIPVGLDFGYCQADDVSERVFFIQNTGEVKSISL